MRASIRVPAAALGVLLLAAPALADPTIDADGARALFREGRGLAAQGKYEAACPKFEQSLKLDPGIGTKFNLADCYEHVGRTATARTLFLEVASIAREAGQDDREKVAEARAKDIEPQIHRLTIDVKQKTSGLVVKRDGVELSPDTFGVAQFVDPGTYQLEVSAPGKKSWSGKVEVPRSGDATVEVPELEDAEAPKQEPAPAPKEEETPPSPAPEQPDAPKPAPDLLVPLVVYGGLGAGAVLGVTSLVLYKSANSKAEKICPSGVNCSVDDIQRHTGYLNDARDARTLAYVGLGIAGAAAITGGVIALIRSKREQSPSTASVSAGPVLAPGTLGAAMAGRF